MNNHLDEIDQKIGAKHLLNHPFYLAWARGELTREALADYARQYYHHVAAFPTYVSAVHAKCDDLTTRKVLLNNLIDEEAGSPNHPQLWLQFAEGLGLAASDVDKSEKWPETQNLVDTFRSICRDGSTADGLAALYAYENQIPAICKSKIDGLKKHYGFENPSHYEYFSVHIEADREHSANERQLLRSHTNQHNFQSVKASVDRVLDALWELLSGVCRRHAIAC
jgi:pyrroloquinoline-quinone synthase